VSVDNILHNGLSITFSLFASKNRDVVIKAVSYGSAQTNELQILRYLNSDLLRSDKTKDNATVPVIEFIEHLGWTFAISPRWSDSMYPAFFNVREVLEWASQLLNVS
jgi:CRISPR/Cas system CMR-associated protein Cmr5 small subunit